jgi:hypothetical protein
MNNNRIKRKCYKEQLNYHYNKIEKILIKSIKKVFNKDKIYN